MNPFTLNSLKPPHTIFLRSPFLSSPLPFNSHYRPNKPLPPRQPISALIIPSSSSSNSSKHQKIYQPFRSPPTESPIPAQFRKLDTSARLDVLTNRLGQWYEYAPLIPPLIREGFSSPTIEEITGISGIEQNLLVVAAQVRDSLVQEGVGTEILDFFDKGGAELLYELRILSVDEREAAARYLIEKGCNPGGAQELARAIKDFSLRRGDRGWDSFEYTIPGDCLAFMYYRQGLEHRDPDVRIASLEKSLSVAVSDKARAWVLKELEGNDEEGEGEGRGGGLVNGKVPVVRLNLGEIAEASVITVLPVSGAEEMEKGVADAPWECGCKGDFGIVMAEKPWPKWVVLPAWSPVAGLSRGGVAVKFSDARALPWKVNRSYMEEAILVVADRSRTEVVADDGFYLVVSGEKLKVKRGSVLKEEGIKQSLGTVLIVVRPPKDDEERMLTDEEWD